MSAITHTESPFLQGFCQGTRRGLFVGVSLSLLILNSMAIQSLLKRGNMILGDEPKWPFYEGDCQLQRFRDMPVCTNPPLFDSATSCIVATIGTTMLIGAVSGIAATYLQSRMQNKR